MRTVEIGGRVYACPFADLLRKHTAAEYADLQASIAQHGAVKVPVSVCTTPTHGPVLIDGMTREGIARELGLPVPVFDHGEMADDAARLLAEDLNASRRQLSPEELAALRQRRNERLADMIEREGLSLRAAAAKEGVSHETARKAAGEAKPSSRVTPEPEPEEPDESFVRGADGKTYRQAPRAAARPTQAAPAVPAYSTELRFTGTVEEFLIRVSAHLESVPGGSLRFHLAAESA